MRGENCPLKQPPIDDDLVFCHPEIGGPLDHSKVLKRIKDALDAAGVRRVRFHDLRHTFGTQMAAAGVPMRTLQEWMGHRDIKTTMIYADYQASDQERELVERAFRSRATSEHSEDFQGAELSAVRAEPWLRPHQSSAELR